MTFKSNLPALRRAMDRAEEAGLYAAAQVGVNATKRGLRGGYTSGDFVTGNSIDAVTIGDPFWTAVGRAIRYGTNLLYNLYWELGHMNVWTGKYERKEVWRPAMLENTEQMRQEYARVYARYLKPFTVEYRGA